MQFNEKNYEIPQVCLDLGFEDMSYRNDGAAWMIHERLRLGLWVCEERPEDRENFSMKRYTVVPINEDCASVMDADKNEEVELLETESDEELRAFVSARQKPVSKQEVKDIVEAAQEAFWAAVVKKLPEATRGDFDPLAHHQFEEMCTRAVRHWIDCNVERGVEE